MGYSGLERIQYVEAVDLKCFLEPRPPLISNELTCSFRRVRRSTQMEKTNFFISILMEDMTL